jgi:hypothetical protein
VPAGIAGYQASLGLAEIGVHSEAWRAAFAIISPVLIGATAFARMTPFVPPPTGQRIVEGQHRHRWRTRPGTVEHRIVLVWLGINAVRGRSHDQAILTAFADAVEGPKSPHRLT